ncbi:Hpt domain-containing protein, partial [Vibrio splendidus]
EVGHELSSGPEINSTKEEAFSASSSDVMSSAVIQADNDVSENTSTRQTFVKQDSVQRTLEQVPVLEKHIASVTDSKPAIDIED